MATRVITSHPVGGRSIVISISVYVLCLSSCFSTLVSKFSVHVIVAHRSSYHGNARWPICYVLPVFWMTSCFYIMGRIGQKQTLRVRFVQLARRRGTARASYVVSSSSPPGGSGREVCSFRPRRVWHFTGGRESVLLWWLQCDIVFPVLWMTSYFHIMGQWARIKDKVMSGEFFASWRHSWCSCYI